VREAANLMRGRAVTLLPVVDHREYLIGIVTISDFLDLLGKGTVKPVVKTTRWTLRHRGVRPNAGPRPAARGQGPRH
jgi:CBS-domain-containing membrane protein